MNPTHVEANHDFVAPTDVDLTRSPCPALNALANHRYIPHDGKDIPYWTLVHALCKVYNISRPLAMLLATVGYATCGKVSFSLSPFPVQWKLSLSALAAKGATKIAHDASLVHPNYVPSHSPDPALVAELLGYASSHNGISLKDFAVIHARKLGELSPDRQMSNYHEQIAMGEYGLSWALMRSKKVDDDDVIPVARIRQWICEERLPDEWWTEGRPKRTIGIIEARSKANVVHSFLPTSPPVQL